MYLSDFTRLSKIENVEKEVVNEVFIRIPCPHGCEDVPLTFRKADEDYMHGGCQDCKDVLENPAKYEKVIDKKKKMKVNYEKSIKKCCDSKAEAISSGDYYSARSFLRGFILEHGTISLATNEKFQDKARSEYLDMTGDELDDSRYVNYTRKKSGWALSWRVSFPMIKELGSLLNFLTEDDAYWPLAGNAVDCPRIENGSVLIARNGYVEELLQTGFRIGKNHNAEEVETYTENLDDFQNGRKIK